MSPGAGSLAPSPKRRRLDALDSAHCDPQLSGDHHVSKSTLPVICLTEETDTLRTNLVNSSTTEGGTGSTELSDKLSISPVDKVTGDPHESRDGGSCPRNDEKTLPTDRRSPPTEDG